MKKLLLYYLRNFPFDYGKNRISKWVKLGAVASPLTYSNNHGIKFQLDLKEYQMKQIYLFDIYEKNTVRHLLKQIDLLQSNRLVVFDVGANIGFYSLTIAQKLKNTNSIIHSFEPNPFTFDVFSKNIALNGFKNIEANQMGLSDKKEKLTLTFNHTNLGAANVFSTNGNNAQEIQLTTLDDYCDQNGIESIDVIKVDIEGSELKFLQGGKKIIERSKKLIVIMEIVDENCIKAGYTSHDLFQFMQNHGFKGYLPKPWPFSLKRMSVDVINYHDNIVFLKGIN